VHKQHALDTNKIDKKCAYPGCPNLGRSKGKQQARQRGKWCHAHHRKKKAERFEQMKKELEQNDQEV
jgi:hypothetical protein